MSDPVLVHVTRGTMVESSHRGAVAVFDTAGCRWACGDSEQLVYARSSIKPLQALPLIESGAADAYGLSEAHLSLACASHGGEPQHIACARQWLQQVGIDERALGCGAHAPMHSASADAMLIAGTAWAPVHNNCSGKHVAMLTIAQHLGDPLAGYIATDHPAQRRWMDLVSELGAVDLYRLPHSVDGCGIPVIAMPLASIARAFAHFAQPDTLSASRAEAVARLQSALSAEPFLVAGSNRLCSHLIEVTAGRVIAKIGAEGVYAAAIRDLGLGVALKINDGSRAACEVALLACLQQLGALRKHELEALADRCAVPIYNTLDVRTGAIQPVDFGAL